MLRMHGQVSGSREYTSDCTCCVHGKEAAGRKQEAAGTRRQLQSIFRRCAPTANCELSFHEGREDVTNWCNVVLYTSHLTGTFSILP